MHQDASRASMMHSRKCGSVLRIRSQAMVSAHRCELQCDEGALGQLEAAIFAVVVCRAQA